jgi:SsrA-binding protein
MPEGSIKQIAANRRAFHDYSVDETIECGMELLGTEVKSFRSGAISFPDSYAIVEGGQVYLLGLHVSEYAYSSVFNHDPDRRRRLLLHRSEIRRLGRKVQEKGYTLIPLRFYFKDGLVKVALGLCKGKKQYDKRADIKERDVRRDMDRESRGRLA